MERWKKTEGSPQVKTSGQRSFCVVCCREKAICRIPAHFSILLFFYLWLDSSSLVSSQIDGRKGIGLLFIVWELLWNSSVIDERQFECLIGLNNDFCFPYPIFFFFGGGGDCCKLCSFKMIQIKRGILAEISSFISSNIYLYTKSRTLGKI